MLPRPFSFSTVTAALVFSCPQDEIFKYLSFWIEVLPVPQFRLKSVLIAHHFSEILQNSVIVEKWRREVAAEHLCQCLPNQVPVMTHTHMTPHQPLICF